MSGGVISQETWQRAFTLYKFLLTGANFTPLRVRTSLIGHVKILSILVLRSALFCSVIDLILRLSGNLLENMDPITALGVAGNIIQFVEFATSLVSTAHKIHSSETGVSPNHLRLEQVCEVLRRLSEKLAAPTLFPSPGTKPSSYHYNAADKDATALRSLSDSCKKDCEKLLGILGNLKVQDGSNRLWKSVKAALRTKTEQKAIAELEDQLLKAERLMSLHTIKIIKCVAIVDT